MEQKKNLDALGLEPERELPKLIPAVQPGDCAEGVLARYLGAEGRESKNFGREQTMHTFELGDAFNRARFALWGSAQLDIKLRGIPKGGVVVLQYMGKPEGERAMHQWSVRQFRGNTQQLRELADGLRHGCEVVAQAIAVLENRTDGSDFDDLPF